MEPHPAQEEPEVPNRFHPQAVKRACRRNYREPWEATRPHRGAAGQATQNPAHRMWAKLVNHCQREEREANRWRNYRVTKEAIQEPQLPALNYPNLKAVAQHHHWLHYPPARPASDSPSPQAQPEHCCPSVKAADPNWSPPQERNSRPVGEAR